MNRRIIIAFATGAMLLGGTGLLAQEQGETKPPMHMHKAEMTHRTDKEVATQYKSEAAQLREKAESHRKLSSLYRTRTPPKGSGSYAAVAAHCDKLAQFYEDAAKEAEAVALELTK